MRPNRIIVKGINLLHGQLNFFEPIRTPVAQNPRCAPLHQEFVRWFGADIAGPEERYATITSEIWQLWQPHRHRAPNEEGHSWRNIASLTMSAVSSTF